ncbi:7437_t:CDS:2, partial [Racocetra persica]
SGSSVPQQKDFRRVIVITSNSKPYMWKTTNISLKKESHVNVIEKTNTMINELKNMNIKISAVVIDSAGPYAASRYFVLFLHYV